jgi:hypothetical protein
MSGILMEQSIVANLHNKRPERRAPTLDRLFYDGDITTDDASGNVDIYGQPFTNTSYRPAFTPGVLNAACDLSMLHHGIINYNLDVLELGIEDNLWTRKQQYQSLQDWRERLPLRLRNEENHTPGTVFLRSV